METLVFEKCDGGQVTDHMLQEAAELFSENYGVWGERAAHAMGGFAKAGSRVRLSKDRLRAQCLFDNTSCSYVRVTIDGHLAGNAFACHWTADNKTICWITQLVVARKYRERGLATTLLNQFRIDNVDIYGLMSSHPAACRAAAKAFGDSLSTIRLDVIATHAREVIEASLVGYIKDAKLRGSIFSSGDSDDASDGLVSSVDSSFFVDHSEPLEALAWAREEMEWPLGELLDGHEFLVIFEARRRSRARVAGR